MTRRTDPTDPTGPTRPTDGTGLPQVDHDPELLGEAIDALGPSDIPDPDDVADPVDAPGALRSVRGESAAAAIGSFMAGIEQQVFQRRPPAIELVQQAQPVRGVSGDGLEITISLPEPSAPER